MKAKHIAFLSLSVLAGTFASCTGSHEIKITGSAKNLDGGTIIYQKSIDGMFNSQSQDTLKLNTTARSVSHSPATDTNRYACSYGESVT